MDGGDDRTFKVNFTGEGAAKLREAVKEKLKEFMGDYTDDTLVVLLLILSSFSPVCAFASPYYRTELLYASWCWTKQLMWLYPLRI